MFYFIISNQNKKKKNQFGEYVTTYFSLPSWYTNLNLLGLCEHKLVNAVF